MVSTRQMSTSGSGSATAGNSSNVGLVVATVNNSANDDNVTPRLSVVTRVTQQQESSTVAGVAIVSGGTSSNTSSGTTPTCGGSITNGSGNVPSVYTRHSHMTQANRASGGCSHMNRQQQQQQQQQNQPQHSAIAVITKELDICVVGTNNSPSVAAVTSTSTTNQLELLDMPTEILMKILSYMDFKKVSQYRAVSSKMNDVCMLLLNSTFSKLITTTYNRFHAIKANMPRRESARRSHPLACECDIIETCYMRLSLLQMTLGKHIERGYCCFFPGAILDEVYTILNYISNTPRLQRPYRVTDELFDLSTMAMEYFRDRIEPTLPGIAYFNKDFFKLPTTTKRPPLVISPDLADSPSSSSQPQNHMVLRKGIRKIKQGMKMYNNQLSVLRTELRNCKRKGVEQGKQIAEQQKLLAEQQKQTLEYANRLDENDKKNEEMSRKFSTLLQELNKCKTELQFWRSKSPAIPLCVTCNQKVTPVLPPEDFQALVNQGVNPDDIIINLNDDVDGDNDGDINERPMLLEDAFVFPDEATTTKLIAVNTAAKNLKRKYQGNDVSTTKAAMPITTTTSNGNTSNFLNEYSVDDGGSVGDIHLLKNKNYEISDAYGAATNSKPTMSKTMQVTMISNNTEASTSKAAAQQQQNGNGCNTKKFYGNQNQQHQRGGVIVSPVSILKKGLTTTAASASVSLLDGFNGSTPLQLSANNNKCAAANIGDNVNSNRANIAGCAVAAPTVVDDNEEVLQETKKARRVQKATRCFNSNGKRSK